MRGRFLKEREKVGGCSCRLFARSVRVCPSVSVSASHAPATELLRLPSLRCHGRPPAELQSINKALFASAGINLDWKESSRDQTSVVEIPAHAKTTFV